MACCDPTERWEARLTKLYAELDALDDALLAVATSGGVQTYSLDDGQTRVTKSKFEIGSMRRHRDSVQNEIAILEQRLGCRRGTSNAGPSF
jgi:hypothetical protein